MLQQLTDRIQNLKHKIDAYRHNGNLYVDGVYQPPADWVNLLQINGASFAQIHQEFMGVFLDRAFREQPLSVRMNAIWSYMVMERYIRHWSGERVMRDAGNKLGLIQQHASQFSGVLNQFISDVNRNERRLNSRDRREWTRAESHLPKHFYQKLLQINSNLFAFNHDQAIEEKAENSYFSPDVLRRAKGQVSGPRANHPISQKERLVNTTVKATLESFPSAFTVQADPDYIDPKTGHELDLPFVNDFAIETDGPHHFQGNAHEPVHHFKALALREAGITRVPVNGCLSDQVVANTATQYGRLLSLDSVHLFHSEHQALIGYQDKIRELMIDVTYKLRSSDLLQDEKAALEQQLKILDFVEKMLRSIVQKRPLEKLFRNESVNLGSEVGKQLTETFNVLENFQRKIEEKRRGMAQRDEIRLKYQQFKAYLGQYYPDTNLVHDLERLERTINDMHPSNAFYQARVKGGQLDKANAHIDALKKHITTKVKELEKYTGLNALRAYWGIIHQDIDDQSSIADLEEEKFTSTIDLDMTISRHLQESSKEITDTFGVCTGLIQQSEACLQSVSSAIDERRAQEERLEQDRRQRAQDYDRRMERKRDRRRDSDGNTRDQKDHRRCRDEVVLVNFNRYTQETYQPSVMVSSADQVGRYRNGGPG